MAWSVGRQTQNSADAAGLHRPNGVVLVFDEPVRSVWTSGARA
jgi:hypothetical protein